MARYYDWEILKDKEAFTKDIAKKLVAMREAKGYNQTEMAKVMDVSRNHISCLERGITAINLHNFIQYCNHCGADILEVLYGEKTPPRAVEEKDEVMSKPTADSYFIMGQGEEIPVFIENINSEAELKKRITPYVERDHDFIAEMNKITSNKDLPYEMKELSLKILMEQQKIEANKIALETERIKKEAETD